MNTWLLKQNTFTVAAYIFTILTAALTIGLGSTYLLVHTTTPPMYLAYVTGFTPIIAAIAYITITGEKLQTLRRAETINKLIETNPQFKILTENIQGQVHDTR